MRVGITMRRRRDDHGAWTDVIESAYVRYLERRGGVVVPLPNDVEDAEAYLEAARLDGYVLSGGEDIPVEAPGDGPSRRVALERAILARAGRDRAPVLGICRGMQS